MKKKKIILGMVAMFVILLILGSVFAVHFGTKKSDGEVIGNIAKKNDKYSNGTVVDDWEYDPSKSEDDSENAYNIGSVCDSSNSVSKDMTSNSVNSLVSSETTIGYSVGGSKNVNNFRENIKNGYFPISTDITYNGLYYDYYFDTGKSVESTELFYPTYSTAVSKDPISGEYEYYMTVGLNSNIKESDFHRKKLNLIVVMDISGSMSSGFNSYYYDGKNNNETKSKMEIANESLNLLIDKLNDDDRIGIVLFDDKSYMAKPVNYVGETDINKIKEHVLEIQPRGGTNFDSGYTSGTELFTEDMLNDSEYENRIIVITDAMPNIGKTSQDSLTKDVEKNANKGIYTTFIGVGVDFNTEVIECLSDVKGANYYSVHNSDEFKKIMGEDFDYMVTPLVFDLELKLNSDLFSIENVYGTDTKDFTSGTIMKVNTLFPSSTSSSGETKGGIILLKLKYNEDSGSKLKEEIEKEILKLSVSYKDRDGKEYSNSQDIQFKNVETENYDNTGIRKGIVLARYANMMKNWILYERAENNKPNFLITEKTGIEDCVYSESEVYEIIGENERMSTALTVSKEYAELFAKFKDYMDNEIKEIGDENMKQEIDILNILIK